MDKVFFFISVLMVAACASPVAPSGGPRDTTPPQLDTSISTPITQTNFSGRSLKLTFDEYVVINNPAQELIISPPLKYIPEMSTEGKSVILAFNEEDTLRENTTYSIQFNESIQDLNEGNSIRDLTYVFSTGENIDSNAIQVQIKNPLSEESTADVHVMLYKSMRDSIVYESKPYYASVTDKSGIAELKYLHEGKYKLFALKDENLNLIYDIPTEKIGFRTDPLVIPGDTSLYSLNLFVARQETALIDEVCMPYGKCVFIFNNRPDDYDIVPREATDRLVSYPSGDSIIFWRSLTAVDSSVLYLDSMGVVIDTFVQEYEEIDSTILSTRNFLKKRRRAYQLNTVRGATISAIRAIKTINSDSISLIDTAGVAHKFSLEIDSIDKTEINVSIPRAGTYTLIFKPKSLEDIYGKTFDDSLSFTMNVNPLEDLSTIIIKAENLDSTSQYILKLKKDENTLNRWIINERDTATYEIPAMKASNYTLMLITDRNKNGKFNKGSYRNKQQPETIVIKEIKGMRPGWDFESTITPKRSENEIKK